MERITINSSDTLRASLLEVTLRLVAIGELLDAHEMGRSPLDAGTEQGLRFERDGLQSRQRATRAALRVQEGGPNCG